MSNALVITGTDTDVGKTVVSAGLSACLPDAFYWKPVQAGHDDGTDRERVMALSGLPAERLLPEVYNLSTPASPHLAARIDNVAITAVQLRLPNAAGPLIVEGAGGVLVPLGEHLMMIDLFVQWHMPTILCARTALGTINHSLLSIEALRARQVPIAGIIFVGDAHKENERIIPQLAGVRSFGRLPRLPTLDAASLHLAMEAHIDIAAIKALLH
ncbi:MAG: dethiobiotin synthase [Sphingobium sp.]